MKKKLKYCVGIIVIYLLLNLVALIFVKRLVFVPHRAGYVDSAWLIKLDSGGKNIYGYHLKNPEAKYVLLVSHGSREDLSDLLPFFHAARKHGFEVFGYDYQGYGLSEGEVSEKNCYKDIEAVYLYLTRKLKILPEKILIFGYGLGSGPSVELAIRYPVGGLILQDAFTSIFRMLTFHSLCFLDYFDNLKKISHLSVPFLLIYGSGVNKLHSEQLFRSAPLTIKKKIIKVKYEDSKDLDGKSFWEVVVKFVQDL